MRNKKAEYIQKRWKPARVGEVSCEHGIGHHHGVHGCDGCCADVYFDDAIKFFWLKEKP